MIVLPTNLNAQFKVFDNGNVGIRYTTSTPLSRFVFNTQGGSAWDIYFYSNSRSSTGGAFNTIVETGTGSYNPTIIKWGDKGAYSYESIYLPTTYNEFLIAMSDYNLDGKEDFVTWAELSGGATRWALYINNGNGSYALKDSEITGIPSGPPYPPYEIEHTPYTYTFSASYEYTGDGRPDVLMRAGDTLLCYTSVSNSPSDNRLENYPADYCITAGLTESYTGDFKGDAAMDALLYLSTVVQTGGFDNRNLVRKIADGLNNKTRFSYKKVSFRKEVPGLQLHHHLPMYH